MISPDHHIVDHIVPKSFVDALDDPFLLVDQLIFEGRHGRGDEQRMVHDLDGFRIAGNGLAHDLLPYVLDLERLDITLQPALFQELLQSFRK